MNTGRAFTTNWPLYFEKAAEIAEAAAREEAAQWFQEAAPDRGRLKLSFLEGPGGSSNFDEPPSSARGWRDQRAAIESARAASRHVAGAGQRASEQTAALVTLVGSLTDLSENIGLVAAFVNELVEVGVRWFVSARPAPPEGAPDPVVSGPQITSELRVAAERSGVASTILLPWRGEPPPSDPREVERPPRSASPTPLERRLLTRHDYAKRLLRPGESDPLRALGQTPSQMWRERARFWSERRFDAYRNRIRPQRRVRR